MTARRSTIQRKFILDELRRGRAHATAVELYQVVRQQLPHLSLGTVYRNLDILCREGLVKKIGNADWETRFDAIVDNHYHLRCSKCGRIEDMDVPVSVVADDSIASAQGWDVTEPMVEFRGLCPACRAGSAQGIAMTNKD